MCALRIYGDLSAFQAEEEVSSTSTRSNFSNTGVTEMAIRACLRSKILQVRLLSPVPFS